MTEKFAELEGLLSFVLELLDVVLRFVVINLGLIAEPYYGDDAYLPKLSLRSALSNTKDVICYTTEHVVINMHSPRKMLSISHVNK